MAFSGFSASATALLAELGQNNECPHPPELATAEFVDFCFAHFSRMNALHSWLVGMQGGAR